MMKNSTNYIIKCLLAYFILIQPGEINAQYFGRNKVQYENFNFNNLYTQNFKILFYPEEKEVTNDAALMLERWRHRFNKIFSDILAKEQPIILYSNHADFQQTNVISGLISQGTGGVTEGLLNRITLPLTTTYTENDHVLGHELVHAYQYTLIKQSKSGLQNAQRIPLWFIEGLAEYLSIGRKDPLTAMWLRDAVMNDDVPSIDDISRDYKYFPYRYGHALWAFIGSYFGDKIINPLFQSVINKGWEPAFDSLLNISVDSLSALWKKEVSEVYGEQIKGKDKPENTGTSLINKESMNLAPVISPDGKYIALITRADLFTLDLYLADTETGELIEELVSSETDSHFDALRFMNSSGAWSPDGKFFAFVAIEDGDDRIVILDVASRKLKREINIDMADAISYISWSPDGNELLFSGSLGGINNLYIYNLTTKETDQMTDDKYTEIHPSWSPDGKSIVFATDRSATTDFNTLNFSPMKIALMERESKGIEIISVGDAVKHTNPYFSPDGRSLLFIADPDGISNLYRYSFDTEKFYKITNTATGISGLTELSPAFSVSLNTGKMVFSIFNNTNYDINTLDYSENIGNEFSFNEEEYINTVSLPLQKKSSEDMVENYLDSSAEGLPYPPDFSVSDYSPSLSLLYIGQSGIGVSVSEFGTGLGGGVSMLFSDLLGNNLLSVIAQVNGTVKDIGGQVMYINRENRFNWGGSVSHIPYLTGFISTGRDTVNLNGTPVLANEIRLIRQRVFDDRITLLSEYPFSQNRRLEFRTGYERISYDLEEERLLTYDGFILERTERELEAPGSLNLFNSALAYVGDYSFFGFTSPIDGSRYRFEAEPTFGSLTFLSALADYRQYIFLNPFTLALRGMHYGRYLDDADSERLTPLYLGFDTWIRGYNINSFDIAECSQSLTGEGCPEFDRLVGSRMGIFNLEFRIPLFGTEQFGLVNFGFLPLELSLFFDGGVAWTSSESPVIKFETKSTERIPVFSSGAAARINLFGYAILQLYYAKPFQRPGAGWQFGFLVSPGW